MSTRCATLVMQNTYWREDKAEREELLRFYRHCDGYPNGHGRDIANAIVESADHEPYAESWSQNLVARLFSKNACMELEPRGCTHGDLEYLYVVEGSVSNYLGAKDVDTNVRIAIYTIGWGQPYSEAQCDEQCLFSGTADECLKWLEA